MSRISDVQFKMQGVKKAINCVDKNPKLTAYFASFVCTMYLDMKMNFLKNSR